jgi:hypothetical protein
MEVSNDLQKELRLRESDNVQVAWRNLISRDPNSDPGRMCTRIGSRLERIGNMADILRRSSVDIPMVSRVYNLTTTS